MIDVGVQAWEKAYNEFKSGDKQNAVGDFLGGGIGFIGGYQKFKEGLPVCEATFRDAPKLNFSAAKFIDFFRNDAEKKMGKEIDEGMEAYKKGDFEKYGEMVGKIFFNVEGQQLGATAPTADKAQNLAEIMQGFLVGAKLGSFNFTALLECIYAADQAALTAYTDVQIAEEAWKNKDIMEGITAAIMVLAIKQGVEQAIPVCESVVGADFSKLNKFNPLALTDGEVLDRVQKAFSKYEANKLYFFGEEIGAAVADASAKNMFVF